MADVRHYGIKIVGYNSSIFHIMVHRNNFRNSAHSMGGHNDNNMYTVIDKKTLMGAKLGLWLYGLIDLTGIGLFMHTFLVNMYNLKSSASFIMFIAWAIIRIVSMWEDIKKKRLENEHKEFELQVKRDNHEYDKNSR